MPLNVYLDGAFVTLQPRRPRRSSSSRTLSSGNGLRRATSPVPQPCPVEALYALVRRARRLPRPRWRSRCAFGHGVASPPSSSSSCAPSSASSARSRVPSAVWHAAGAGRGRGGAPPGARAARGAGASAGDRASAWRCRSRPTAPTRSLEQRRGRLASDRARASCSPRSPRTTPAVASSSARAGWPLLAGHDDAARRQLRAWRSAARSGRSCCSSRGACDAGEAAEPTGRHGGMTLLEVLAATAILMMTCAAVTTVVVTAAHRRAAGRSGAAARRRGCSQRGGPAAAPCPSSRRCRPTGRRRAASWCRAPSASSSRTPTSRSTRRTARFHADPAARRRVRDRRRRSKASRSSGGLVRGRRERSGWHASAGGARRLAAGEASSLPAEALLVRLEATGGRAAARAERCEGERVLWCVFGLADAPVRVTLGHETRPPIASGMGDAAEPPARVTRASASSSCSWPRPRSLLLAASWGWLWTTAAAARRGERERELATARRSRRACCAPTSPRTAPGVAGRRYLRADDARRWSIVDAATGLTSVKIGVGPGSRRPVAQRERVLPGRGRDRFVVRYFDARRRGDPPAETAACSDAHRATPVRRVRVEMTTAPRGAGAPRSSS